MKSTEVTNRLLGKTIKKVELRSKPDGRGGRYQNPVITFTDGTRLAFSVTETEVAEYGVTLCVFHKTQDWSWFSDD